MSTSTEGPASTGAVEAEWTGLKSDVGQFADEARAQAIDYVGKRKGDAAQSVADIARSVRDSGHGFKDQPNIQAFFDNAAEGLEQLAGSIRERSLEDLYREVEGVVRRRPAAVAAATFATGFLLARFIKASAANVGRPAARPAEPYDLSTGPQV